MSGGLIYLNHAGVSPIPVRSATKGVEQIREYLNFGAYNLRGWIEISETCRERFARLIGARPDEVAFVKNTSEGLSFVAGGIDWKPGDNLVTISVEFPANIYPWLALEEKGVEVRLVEPEEDGTIDENKLISAADEKTRLISVSSVQFVNGYRLDLEKIGAFCRENGIFFCVDAIQSLGVIPMDVEKYNIDFLAADGHKWLLSIEGIGGFYVSSRVMDRINPIEYGWHSVKKRFEFEAIDFSLDDTARKFEPGSFNVLSIAMFSESLNLILEVGVERIRDRVFQLTEYLIDSLDDSWELISPTDQESRSGIITFRIPGVDGKTLWKKLLERKVVVSPRGGGIRVSPHFYNTEEELDRFLELTREAAEEILEENNK